jgi:hypothetical protein
VRSEDALATKLSYLPRHDLTPLSVVGVLSLSTTLLSTPSIFVLWSHTSTDHLRTAFNYSVTIVTTILLISQVENAIYHEVNVPNMKVLHKG